MTKLTREPTGSRGHTNNHKHKRGEDKTSLGLQLCAAINLYDGGTLSLSKI